MTVIREKNMLKKASGMRTSRWRHLSSYLRDERTLYLTRMTAPIPCISAHIAQSADHNIMSDPSEKDKTSLEASTSESNQEALISDRKLLRKVDLQ